MKRASAISPNFFCLLVALGLLAAGCSGSSNGTDANAGGSVSVGGADPEMTGGALGTGGATSTASNSPSSGGKTQSGGVTGIGGTSQIATSATAGSTATAGGRSSVGGSAAGGTTSTRANPTGGTKATGGNASSSGASPTGGKTATGGTKATGGNASSSGASPTGGKTATGSTKATGGASTTGGSAAAGGANTGGSTSLGTQCSSALPSGAAPVDTSDATVIGTGTPDSCRFSDLSAAVAKGGMIRFDCGSAPHTIAVTATMTLPTDKNTVIDGGGTITLDGQDKVRILFFEHMDWMVNDTRVTLQRLRVINGRATPTERIPTADPPCSQGWNDGEGGALYMRDGNLTVIDCTFSNNHAADLGPDTGGGAIYINGSKNGALIVGSTFTNNSASNAGAIGGLFAELQIYNSLFDHNTATGHDANNNEPDKCDAINNGQNETGSGGNGGAIYQDGGNSTNVLLCGVQVTNNAAGTNAFGGGVFMTSNDWSGTITIRDSTITGNTGGSWTQVKEGSVTNLGTAFGVNAKSATVSNSTLQQRN